MLMVGTMMIASDTINGVRSNWGMPAVAGGEQEWAILGCMSVGTVDARLQKNKGGKECSGNGCHRYIRDHKTHIQAFCMS